MIAAPVSDLPAPDSPTTPRISPAEISNETSSSASSVPRRPGNSTFRCLTSSSAPLIQPCFAGAGVQPGIGSSKSTRGVNSFCSGFCLTATR